MGLNEESSHLFLQVTKMDRCPIPEIVVAIAIPFFIDFLSDLIATVVFHGKVKYSTDDPH